MKSSKGFSLIEAMVVMGLLGVASMAGMALFEQISKEQKRVQVMAVLQENRDKVYKLLEEPQAWSQTIANNASMACLMPAAATDCNHGDNLSPTLFTIAGTSYYNPATQGFSRNGVICNLSDGDSACPFKYQISTKLACPGTATCSQPAVVTLATLVVAPDIFPFPINPERFQVEVFHSGGDRKNPSYSANCLDWQARGWASQDNCLTDGRWHRVFTNAADGSVLSGTIADLTSHIQAGVDVQIVFGASVRNCSLTYVNAGVARCLTPVGFAGEAPAFVTFGAARFSSDGTITCTNKETPLGGNECAGLTGEMTWMIRY